MGEQAGQRKAEITSLVSRASWEAGHLSLLRNRGISDTNFIYSLEVGLDCFLLSVSERSPYSRLSRFEQDRLQQVKRYRTQHPYDVPAEFICGMIPARLVHPAAQAYLDSFTQEPERKAVW